MKKNFILGIVALVAVVFGLMVAYVAFTSGEIQDSEYKTFADLKASGYLERGWIPRCLPDAASSIYERHDLDTNEVWLKFDFGPKDEKAMRSILSQIEENPKTFDFSKRGSPSWWPKEMLPGSKIHRLSHRADGGAYQKNAYFMVDWRKSTVYYWYSSGDGLLSRTRLGLF